MTGAETEVAKQTALSNRVGAEEDLYEAYTNYVNLVETNADQTEIDNAEAALRDTTDNAAKLDNQTNTVNDKTDKVETIQKQLIALTGTADPTAAAQAAQDKVTAATGSAQTATDVSDAANNDLTDAQTANGAIKTDATRTSAVRADDAKSGDAAVRVGGSASITAGGSIGDKNGNALTMNIDGTTTVKAGEDVTLQSGQDVKLDKLTAGGSSSVTGHGDIVGVGSDPTVTAKDVALNAVSTGNESSTVGKADGKPMTVDTDGLSLRGDDVDIITTGGVALGDIVAENVTINANGNVTQKDGAEIDADELEIHAKGDIGTEDKPIETNVNTITADGKDVYLDNHSMNLIVKEIIGKTVEINTAGAVNTAVPDGLITARNLTITAGYDVGTKEHPLRIRVDGTVSISSRWGDVFYDNFRPSVSGKTPDYNPWRLLEDKISKIRVLGIFSDTARLEVLSTAHYAMLADPTLQETFFCDEDLHSYSKNCPAASAELYNTLIDGSDSDVCKLLWAVARDGRALCDFVLGIFSETDFVCGSRMYFEISLDGLLEEYDGSLEGETLYVMLCVSGELICVPAMVQDGTIRFTLDRLGMNNADYGYTPFVIVEESVFNGLLEEIDPQA